MDFLQITECIFAIVMFRLDFGSAYCRFIETPGNGRVVNPPTYKAGSSIDFECIEGYEMNGQSKLLCQADGRWSPHEPPTCKIKTCGDFGLVLHGDIFQEKSSSGIKDSYGSIVHVSCFSNYILDGPLRVVCQADGTWGMRPQCKETKCPPYPGLNSSCIDISVSQGSFLFIICREDVSVTRKGPEGVECIDGNWETTKVLMGCYCDCKIKADLRLMYMNNAEKGYIGHTSKLDWTCKAGYKKNVTEPLICNDGLIGTPTCVQGEAELPPIEPPDLTFFFIFAGVCVLETVVILLYLRYKTINMSHDYVLRSQLSLPESLWRQTISTNHDHARRSELSEQIVSLRRTTQSMRSEHGNPRIELQPRRISV